MEGAYLETISTCVSNRPDAVSPYKQDVSLRWWRTQRPTHEVIVKMKPTENAGRLEDPIVEEVRAVRAAIDEEVGHDIAKLAERARRIGEQYRRANHVAAVEN
jgi:hypothetical protein